MVTRVHCMLTMAAFLPQEQGWVAAAETERPAKPTYYLSPYRKMLSIPGLVSRLKTETNLKAHEQQK